MEHDEDSDSSGIEVKGKYYREKHEECSPLAPLPVQNNDQRITVRVVNPSLPYMYM